MNLTESDLHILATRHGNAYECREIRQRLASDGQKYCPACANVKALSDFAKNGPRALASRCKLCSWKHRRSRIEYVPVAGKERDAERQRRWRSLNRKIDILRKRLHYWRRRAAGLRGRVANYMAPAPEFDEPRNAIKR